MHPQPRDPLGPRLRLDLGHLRDRAGEVGPPLRHGDPYLPARHRHRPGLPAYVSAGYRPLPARRPDQHRRGHDLLGDVADVDVQ